MRRRWLREYTHDGSPWLQHIYAFGLAEHRTIMMTAQAPAEHWPAVRDAALTVATSFQPLS